MSSEASALTLSGPRKAAALLITLGTEASAKLLARLPPEALDRVALELLRMPAVDATVRDAILEEAYAGLFAHAGVLPGGENYALELFGQAFGQGKARELLDRVHMAQQIIPFDFMRDIEAPQAAGLLSEEHPQTIALILAYLDPQKGASILSELRHEIQADVAKRIATMDRTSPDVLREVERVLERKLSTLASEDYTSAGGIDTVVEVLNNVDRGTEKIIIEALEEDDPELAEEIKKRMFVFEDIVLLDDRSIQKVLREVDTQDLAKALKGVDAEVQEKIFRNMSKRASSLLKEDMDFMGPVRLRDVEEAQQKIVNIIRKLEESGDIVVARAGEEELVV